jgi:CheY-like chemotaxis protein
VKILVVDSDQARAQTLQRLLTASAAEVTVATSGSFALTMLEWNKQDVIVSRARIDDMEGHELCSLVRSDPSTKDVRFVLIASVEEGTSAETVAAGIDLVLPSTMTGSMIVPLVVQLVRHDLGGTLAHDPPTSLLAAASPSVVVSRPAPHVAAPAPQVAPSAPPPVIAPQIAAAPPAPTPPPAATPSSVPPRPTPPPAATPSPAPPTVAAAPPAAAAAASGVPAAAPRVAANGNAGTVRLSDLDAVGAEGAVKTFQGSLGVMEMEELVQAISLGGKTGRLLLVLSSGGGMIVFNGGHVVHAEFGPKSGEPAFAALVSTAHRERAGKFCFIPSDGRAAANGAATINKSTDQLLRSIAKAMDEEK